MTFRAMSDRVLILPDAAPDKVGSLYIPDTAKAALQRKTGRTGIVRFMGPGMLTNDGMRWPMPDVKIGDRVLFLDQPWPETEIAGEKLLSMRDEAVLAVVENDR
jgi:co-chaperonin GroES (HSP10)